MDPTISVSKGCFVFKNGATRADKRVQKSAKRKRAAVTSMLGKEVTEQPFYRVYAETWQKLQTDLEQLQKQTYTSILESLVQYVTVESGRGLDTFDMEEILPAAALLTGINQPDHLEQFELLSQWIGEHGSSHVCMLQSRDCATLKAAVETMVYNFIESPQEDSEDRDNKRLRRSQCTMKELKLWFRNNFNDCNNEQDEENASDDDDDNDDVGNLRGSGKQRSERLVVIIPDFECFNSAVLQDLILILSANYHELPFVLVFGIATSMSAVHSSLPYHVTSKIKLRVFQTPAAPHSLNEILEKVVLSPKYAFHLSGKTFKFLTHIFLYYDFSISGFIQGFKYCLMEHFFQGNAYALCVNYTDSLTKIKSMTHEDMETIRRLLSFRPYVEKINDCKRIIAILTDDDYLKKKLPQLLRDCHLHFMLLRIFLEFLTVLVGDLPKCPLGKYMRELYVNCLSKELTEQPEFKECWQILSFMSKDEFVAKISKAIKITQEFIATEIKGLEMNGDCQTVANEKLRKLKDLLTNVVISGMTPTSIDQKDATSPERQQIKQVTSRQDLKEQLLQLSKQSKSTSEFVKSVNEILSYIQTEIIIPHLAPLQRSPPLHELFVFSDISTVRRNIIGAPRAALHMALNNPHFYLQCKCCALRESAQLLPSLPDLSIVYKLHLECGRMINLFDWLQAFRAIVVDEEDDQEVIDPKIQARFTRAVAELQFLGYIKMSKRKTDHATRLTW